MTPSAAAILPTVAAVPPVDPTVLVDVSIRIRAVGSFAFVLLVGGAVLVAAEGFVDRSVDASMETPLKSIAYGVSAQAVIALLGLYAIDQLTSIGPGSPFLATIGPWLLVLAWLALAGFGFGFVVVGAGLTDIAGNRQLWPGLTIGAAVSTFVWALSTLVFGVVVWLLVTSIGIGGPARRWLYASIEGDAGVDG
ncbi:hypothetical protein BRC86_03065 [Halobacteriales archaeon QS_3_64_16]|nr:MAG: hypothetical protein BRC86_03065 [Halobacteriales archaeon QS_3_64_16]